MKNDFIIIQFQNSITDTKQKAWYPMSDKAIIAPNPENLISWTDFQKVDLRIGTIVKVDSFPKAKKPAYKLWVDLGEELGIKQSSAQITNLYTQDALPGQQVLCLVNFPPRKVADFMSEILVTGFILPEGSVVLAQPGKPVPNGTRLAWVCFKSSKESGFGDKYPP